MHKLSKVWLSKPLFSMFHVTDWYPTLLSLAGADQEKRRRLGIDGVDQWAAVRSRGRTCPSLFARPVQQYTLCRIYAMLLFFRKLRCA